MAHIPDGFLSAQVIAATAVASAASLAAAASRSRRQLGDREATTLGATTAFVFASQMLNFPLGTGTSAHLLGGALVAIVVGPWSGMLVMFAVLLVQALLLQDGGIAALGANTLNIAVVGVGAGYGVYRWITTLLGAGPRRQILAAALAGYVSAVLVAVGVTLELSLSGTVPLRTAGLVVVGSYLLVAVPEAVLTGAIVGVLIRTRSRLVAAREQVSRRARGLAIAGLAAALLLGIGAAYVASSQPDGLEQALTRLGMASPEPASGALPLSDYAAPFGGPWLVAAIGVVAAFIFASVLMKVVAHLDGRR